MALFLLTVLGLFVAVTFGYILAMYMLLRWPGRFSLLRKLLALANGMISLKSDDIVFQEDIFSCGFAAMKMLARQIKSHELEKAIELNQQGSLFITMLEMMQFVRRNGYKAIGYEFKGIEELEAFRSQESDPGVLLLIKNYEELMTPASLLMEPFYFVMRLLRIGDNFGSGIDHWVVLDNLSSNRITLKDPFFGNVQLTRQRFKNIWEGNALVVFSCQEVIG